MDTVVFGSTGAVGGQILAALLAIPEASSVKTISRRVPSGTSPKLTTIEESDSAKWTSHLTSLQPPPTIVFNAVGTTRAAAGGIENQRKIDHDLCIEIARSAKAAGVKTFVFVSSAGTRGFIGKHVPYSKMKIGVEDAIQELEFENAIILRPGAILARDTPKLPLFENLMMGLGKIHQGLQDMFGQEQQVIGRAAVAAARAVQQGKAPSKYWILEQTDVLRLGRTEWAN